MYYTFHSKGNPGQVRVTVTAVVEDGKAKFGVSRCSTNDHFVKKIGYDRSLKRAVEKPLCEFRVPSTRHQVKWFSKIAKFISEQVQLDARLV